MPRVKRRIKSRRAGWTRAHIDQLLTGFDFFGDAFGEDDIHGPCDWAAMRTAWKELKGELLPAWIAEHPGTRPSAWWHFDAPERRRRADGGVHPFDDDERNAKVAKWREQHPEVADREAYKLHFGKPTCMMASVDACQYETEADYLGRHGLLTDAEKQALEVTQSNNMVFFTS